MRVSAGISTVVCDLPAKVHLLLDCVAGKQHSLKTLILMEEFDSELVAQAQKCGIDIISLKDAEASCWSCSLWSWHALLTVFRCSLKILREFAEWRKLGNLFYVTVNAKKHNLALMPVLCSMIISQATSFALIDRQSATFSQ